MLKEYLHEAVSLLTEAVFGTPSLAEASHTCDPNVHWDFVGISYGICTSCGADKKKRFYVYRSNDGRYCYEQRGCVYC